MLVCESCVLCVYVNRRVIFLEKKVSSFVE